MSNNTDAKAALSGAFQGQGGPAEVDNLTDLYAGYRKATTDAAANSVIALDQFWVNPFPFPVRVVSAVLKPDGSVAIGGANSVGVSLHTDDGLGGTQGTAMLWSNASGYGFLPSGASPSSTSPTGFVNRVPAQGSGSATAMTVPPGGGLYLNMAKNGTGQTMPSFKLEALLRRV